MYDLKFTSGLVYMIFFFFLRLAFCLFPSMRMQDVTDPLDLSTIKRKKRLTNAQLFLQVSESVSTLFTENKISRFSVETARDLGFLATVAVQGAVSLLGLIFIIFSPFSAYLSFQLMNPLMCPKVIYLLIYFNLIKEKYPHSFTDRVK